MPISKALARQPESAGDAPAPEAPPIPDRPRRLRLASFNIQTGISTSSYRDYITGGWRHVWPSRKRLPNLLRIAQLLKPFDIVGLQEVDGGGARSQHIVQTQYLAEQAGFAHWHHQINRRVGNISLHCNGLLSRLRPDSVHDYKLPGLPGRGALLARFGQAGEEALYLCVLHLALVKRSRMRQLAFVGELLHDLPYAVVMGDFNCGPNSPEVNLLTTRTRLCDPACEISTFPSWRPQQMLDHILVTPALHVENLRVLDFACSDHLPVAMDIGLPERLAARLRPQPRANG